MGKSTSSFLHVLGPIETLVTGLSQRDDDPDSTTAAALDSHTLPIIFGTIGAVLTVATIVIGIIQIHDMRKRRADNNAEHDENDIELGLREQQAAAGGQEAGEGAPT